MLTEKEMMCKIDKTPMYILTINKPNIKLVRHAIKNDIRLLKFFPTIGNIKQFLDEDNFDIVEFIKKVPLDILNDIILENPDLIIYIENPTRDMIINSLEKFPDLVTNIKNIDEDILIHAINRNPHICNLIKTESLPVLRTIIKHFPEYILRLRNPINELILLAVDEDPTLVKLLDSELITDNVINKVIRKNPIYATLFEDLNENHQMALIVLDPLNIRYIKNPLQSIKEVAISRDINSIYYIKDIDNITMDFIRKQI